MVSAWRGSLPRRNEMTMSSIIMLFARENGVRTYDSSRATPITKCPHQTPNSLPYTLRLSQDSRKVHSVDPLVVNCYDPDMNRRLSLDRPCDHEVHRPVFPDMSVGEHLTYPSDVKDHFVTKLCPKRILFLQRLKFCYCLRHWTFNCFRI